MIGFSSDLEFYADLVRGSRFVVKTVGLSAPFEMDRSWRLCRCWWNFDNFAKSTKTSPLRQLAMATLPPSVPLLGRRFFFEGWVVG